MRSLVAGEPARYSLTQAESYQIASDVDTAREEWEVGYADIAGTRVVADKPIGVVSANTRTRVEEAPFLMLAGNSVKDLMAEWMTTRFDARGGVCLHP